MADARSPYISHRARRRAHPLDGAFSHRTAERRFTRPLAIGALMPTLRAMHDAGLSVWLVAADAYFARGLSSALVDEGVTVVLDGPHDVVLWDARGPRPPDLTAPLVALVEDDAGAEAALLGGAAGVVALGAPADVVAAALVAVTSGLVVVDPRFRAALARAPAPATPTVAVDPGLTAREREVLTLLVDGLTNREIAAELDVSVHTAKFHVNAILQKLGAMTRTEAVVIAARSGLVEI
jgi:DNA-binding CsgD family transcriptional regulator